MPQERWNFAAFSFWPAEPTRITRLNPRTGESVVVQRHPQPLQTVSVSPDGRRHLLRCHIRTPGQSVGTTGSAYLLDLQTGAVASLGVGGLFSYQWSTDGGLLVWGGLEGGRSGVVWAPSGPVERGGSDRFGRLLYVAGKDEFFASATLSPDGRYAAVFAGSRDWSGKPLTLHLLSQTGKAIKVIPDAVGVTQGPGALTWVPAAWAPDVNLLAYGGTSARREENEPMQVWLLDPAGGNPRPVTDKATAIGPWSPGGDRLFLPGVGVVDREGNVLLAEPRGPAAWSPDGRRLFLEGTVYDTATWKAPWTTPDLAADRAPSPPITSQATAL